MPSEKITTKKSGSSYVSKDSKGNYGYGNTEASSLSALRAAQDKKKK